MLRHWDVLPRHPLELPGNLPYVEEVFAKAPVVPAEPADEFVVYGGRVNRLSCPPNALDGRGDYLWLNDEWRKRLTFIKSAFFGCWVLIDQEDCMKLRQVRLIDGDWCSEWAL